MGPHIGCGIASKSLTLQSIARLLCWNYRIAKLSDNKEKIHYLQMIEKVV